MNLVMDKTYELIDVIDKSLMMNRVCDSLVRVYNNCELIDLIKKYKMLDDKYEMLDVKRRIYEYPEYVEYIKSYNELMMIILKINSKFREYTNNRGCGL